MTSRCWPKRRLNFTASRSSRSLLKAAILPQGRPQGKIVYKDLPHFTDIDTAIENGGALVIDPMTLKRGDAKLEMDVAPRRLTGTMRIGGQEHFISKATSPWPCRARTMR